jgi:geranylgeranyl diphosphate synthase type II
MLSDAAAAALELVHCASLVHDDLPAFDDANLRRGRPSVHRAFGVAQAVLVGDGLIFLAFEHLARSCAVAPDRGLPLITALGHRGGPARGICAGQAWELEPEVDLRAYHLAKTGALFIAATQMGAIAAGWKPGPWKELGSRIGEAFQVADDLKDALLSSGVTGKPSGRDEALGRPSAVRDMGPSRARDYLESLLSDVASTIPECPGRSALATKILTFARSTLSNATAPAPSR